MYQLEKVEQEEMAKEIKKGIKKRTLDIAKNMLADHCDMDVIAKITRLPVEQINAIQ